MANATALTERRNELVAFFETKKDTFQPLMESPAAAERFMRVVKNAILRDPQIAEASTQSVFLECQKCAADGLVLDGREAVLTRFKTKRGNDWQTEVVYVPMIKGLQKLVSQAPQILDWTTGLVYENELKQGLFDYQAGDTPILKHKPIIFGERGPVVAAYSVVRMRSGVVKIEVMTRGQLDKIKNRTKSKKQDGTLTGPWASDEEEMQRKTVARRHFKSLPLTDKLTAAFERVDDLYDRSHADMEDLEPVEQPASVQQKRKTSAAEKLKKAKPQEEEQRPLDGEIITEDGEVIEANQGGSEQQEDDEF